MAFNAILHDTAYSATFLNGLRTKFREKMDNEQDEYMKEFLLETIEVIEKILKGTDPDMKDLRMMLTRFVQMYRQSRNRCRLYGKVIAKKDATDEEILQALNAEDEEAEDLLK